MSTMKRRWVGWILSFVLAVLGAGVAWVFFAGGSGTPSTELTTPQIATTLGGSTSSSSQGAATTEAGDAARYVIDASQSTASYAINEVLNGRPTTAVGSTQQVAGQFEVSSDGTVVFSPIVVNARTFTSDSSNRDRLVRGPVILNSAQDQFEFIEFVVNDLEGALPTQVGTRAELTVSGSLTVKGTTQNVVFVVIVEENADGSISGEAEATVLRSDFGIGIPSVPSVADVADQVLIRLDFVALPG